MKINGIGRSDILPGEKATLNTGLYCSSPTKRKQAEAVWRRAKRNREGFAHKPFVIDQLLNEARSVMVIDWDRYST